MEGFIFQTNKKYYFIETTYTNKTKTIAKRFLDYFMNEKYNCCGFIPLHIVSNTFNKIYNTMRRATIKLSNDKTMYFIHEKYAGATIPKTDIVIIKEVN